MRAAEKLKEFGDMHMLIAETKMKNTILMLRKTQL